MRQVGATRRRVLIAGGDQGVSLALDVTDLQADRFAIPAAQRTKGMEKVLGFGGFFFRASDPAGLAQWYARVLGIDEVPTNYDGRVWVQEAGPTVFNPFASNTDYFGDPARQFMLNFRVRDLDAMVRQIRAFGTTVEVDPETYPNGRFARFSDPEGNPIAIWQPA
jgi:predicted enzyme related to lactoylglutathione lyase